MSSNSSSNSRRIRPNQRKRLLHLFTLSQLGIAWPLLELLGRQPEFFTARQAGAKDILLLTVILCVLLPAALYLLQAVLASLHKRLGQLTYLLLFTVLVALAVLSLTGPGNNSSMHVLLASGITVLCTAIYLRFSSGGLFVSLLSPAIVVVPLAFLLSAGIRNQLRLPSPAAPVAPRVAGNGTPVIFIVFDELTGRALQNASGQINAGLFPGFKKLADTASWYPNATTVATSTVLAIPAMLTGNFPRVFKMPHYGNYPDNLFTWLGSDYRMNVSEAVSVLCPGNLCREVRAPGAKLRPLLMDLAAVYLQRVAGDVLKPYLPVVNRSWQGFWYTRKTTYHMYEDRMQQLDAFAARVRGGQRPALNFIHINFPHIPYEYLPSGKRYQNAWLIPGLINSSDVWADNEWNAVQNYQRFLFQLQAIDGWLLKFLQQLQNKSLYDRSLIIVTADHGVAFSPGHGRRGPPPLQNLDDFILPVPLFIKAPFQQYAQVLRNNAQSIDIMPTIAAILQRPLTWHVDGESLLDKNRSQHKRAVFGYKDMRVYLSNVDNVANFQPPEWLTRNFPEGADQEALFLIGNHPKLLGKTDAVIAASIDPALKIRLEQPANFRHVDPSSQYIPAHISGWSNRGGELAIAVNGTIAALTTAFPNTDSPDSGHNEWRFSAIVPEQSFRAGDNQVQVYAVADGPPVQLIGTLQALRQADKNWHYTDSKLYHGRQTLAIRPKALPGAIDYISEGGSALEISGWAIDRHGPRKVKQVLVFRGEQMIYQGTTNILRDETHRFGVLLALGFQFVIPKQLSGSVKEGELRVFAISADGLATQLN